VEPGHPASDYSCPACGFWYQLKSQKSRLGDSITDGAYAAMMNAIRHDETPNFYFMQYPPTLKLRWAGDRIIKRPVHRSLWRRWKAAFVRCPLCPPSAVLATPVLRSSPATEDGEDGPAGLDATSP